MIKRIGFPCKWIDTVEQIEGIKPKDPAKIYQTGTTTVSWLNRQTKDVAVAKLWDLVKNNIRSAQLLVERIGSLDPHLRMVRLGSDMLPVYTQADWRWFWQEPDVRAYAEKHFAEVGNTARALNVKLSSLP
jgi:UV DNA damage repair endonuclease